MLNSDYVFAHCNDFVLICADKKENITYYIESYSTNIFKLVPTKIIGSIAVLYVNKKQFNNDFYFPNQVIIN